MDLKKRILNINRYLTLIYGKPVKLSDLLTSGGVSSTQIAILKANYLSVFLDKFVEIIENILTVKSTGSKRKAEIIIRRFGLRNEKTETLKNVGKVYHVTRERIRQLQNITLRKVKSSRYKKLLRDNLINTAKKILTVE